MLQAIVPRSLGPAAYGNYGFLSGFFADTLGFLDGGSSVAFFVKLTQRPTEAGLASFYARYGALVGLVIAGGLLLAFGTGAASVIWPSQVGQYIVLAAAMAFGNWLISITSRTVDAHALTTRGEMVVLAHRAVLVACTVALYLSSGLNLGRWLALQVTLNTVLIVCLMIVLHWSGHATAFLAPLSSDEIRTYRKEYWTYSHPLLAYALVAMLGSLGDRWILQHFAGSVQQGFLTLGAQFATVIFLFVGAMPALLTREFAQSLGSGGPEVIRDRFMNIVPPLYALTAAISVFFALEAGTVIRIFAGTEFALGRGTVAVMCLLPMGQALGQLGSTVFYATGRTRYFRNTGIAGTLAGLGVAWVLVAPKDTGGMALGSFGVALKLFLTQLFVVNIWLIANARYLGLSCVRLLTHEIAAPLAFALVGIPMTLILGGRNGPLLELGIVGLGYSVACVFLIWLCPQLVLPVRGARARVAAGLREFTGRTRTTGNAGG